MRSVPQADYMLWIMLSTVGLLQALAAYYGWTGLSFFRGRPAWGYVCAAVLVPVSYWWFFIQENRNTPGLEGWQLFSRFAVGVGAGLVAVLLISSILNRNMPAREEAFAGADAGLDVMRRQPYARAVLDALRRAVTRGES